MVFCNTLNSSRAVDHFLTENQISTVNYHGEVPAEERFVVFLTLLCFLSSRWLTLFLWYLIINCRVENLNKFRKEEGDCPTLVCTDLAARGLDLDVDHVIMFDFPSNSVCVILPIWSVCLYFLPSQWFLCTVYLVIIVCAFRLITFTELDELHAWEPKVTSLSCNWAYSFALYRYFANHAFYTLRSLIF